VRIAVVYAGRLGYRLKTSYRLRGAAVDAAGHRRKLGPLRFTIRSHRAGARPDNRQGAAQ
jgi:hypothetical protein